MITPYHKAPGNLRYQYSASPPTILLHSYSHSSPTLPSLFPCSSLITNPLLCQHMVYLERLKKLRAAGGLTEPAADQVLLFLFLLLLLYFYFLLLLDNLLSQENVENYSGVSKPNSATSGYGSGGQILTYCSSFLSYLYFFLSYFYFIFSYFWSDLPPRLLPLLSPGVRRVQPEVLGGRDR